MLLISTCRVYDRPLKILFVPFPFPSIFKGALSEMNYQMNITVYVYSNYVLISPAGEKSSVLDP
jgi:hypothetical protein